MRGGVLRLAKMAEPVRFGQPVRQPEPDGRWYVSFAIDGPELQPLLPTGRAADLVRGNDVIVIEDLNVSAMVKNRETGTPVRENWNPCRLGRRKVNGPS
jgi:hypothetical protein